MQLQIELDSYCQETYIVIELIFLCLKCAQIHKHVLCMFSAFPRGKLRTPINKGQEKSIGDEGYDNEIL